MYKQISFKKILLVFLFIVGFNSLNSAITHSFEINNQSRNATASTKKTQTNLNNRPSNDFLLAKKTGGRSGGGSFNQNKPSRSNSSSGSSNSYSSPSDSSSDSSSYSSYSGSADGKSRFIGLAVIVGFAVIVCVLVRLGVIETYSSSSQSYSVNINETDYTEFEYDPERDNDRVTVSLLQVVLSSDKAADIKQNLNKLSIEVDTSSNQGLIKLMQETAVILLRNQEDWVYAFSSSESLDISQAEQTFDRLSIAERSKFSRETLNNVDGTLQTSETDYAQTNMNQAYLVVTLIAGTADDNPLFEKIYSTEELQNALIQVTSMRDDYLMKFELLWTPQQNNEYLTEEELLIEYNNLIMLV